MIQHAAELNNPESVKQIMKDIGQDGRGDMPILRTFLEEAAKVASAALV